MNGQRRQDEERRDEKPENTRRRDAPDPGGRRVVGPEDEVRGPGDNNPFNADD